MADFAIQRKTMVDNQIRTVDVTDFAVLDAFGSVAREAFVPEALRTLAYVDRPVSFPGGRTLMQPAPLAKLVQLARPLPGERVLVVGGATGYTAAIVAALGATVTLLEEDAALAAQAKTALDGTGVAVVEGPLVAGSAAGAPYDLVLFDGSVEVLPEAFTALVAEGGRIVGVQGRGLSGKAVVSVKAAGKLSARTAFNLQASVLPGFERPKEFAF